MPVEEKKEGKLFAGSAKYPPIEAAKSAKKEFYAEWR